MTVYADVLFLINFSMDALTLSLACAASKRPMRRGRILGASAVGGAAATAAVAVPGLPDWALILGGIAVSAGMAVLTFGWSSGARLFRDTAAVWSAGTLLGGLMTLLLSFGFPVFSGGDGFPAAYCAAAGVSFLWTRIRRAGGGGETVRVRVEAGGREAAFTGLCDTGSAAVEPIGGLPAILVRRGAAEELARLLDRTASGDAGEEALRLRMIPVRGIGGERLLTGFLPDRVYVGDGEVAAAVAIDDEGNGYGGADALVPASLIP